MVSGRRTCSLLKQEGALAETAAMLLPAAVRLAALLTLLGGLVVGAAAGAGGDSLPAPPGQALGDRVKVGAYVRLAGRPHADPVAPQDLAAVERGIGHRLDLVHYFFTWGRALPEALSSNVDGRELMLSLKPDGGLVEDIASGRQDPYIDQFARDARTWGGPLYLRFGHEMNGEWMSYSAGRPGGPSAARFRAAWVRLVERVRAQGASQVRFVWSPNESDFPDVAGNHMEDYWPGDQYVDVAGFDAYNWSSQQPARGDGTWRTFEQIVAGPYARITAFTSRPLWLTEFGTTEAVPGVDPAGAGKAQWFRDMYASRRFPRLAGLVYFSERDDRDVQRDWRLDSSAGSLAAFGLRWSGGVRGPAPTAGPAAGPTG